MAWHYNDVNGLILLFFWQTVCSKRPLISVCVCTCHKPLSPAQPSHLAAFAHCPFYLALYTNTRKRPIRNEIALQADGPFERFLVGKKCLYYL